MQNNVSVMAYRPLTGNKLALRKVKHDIMRMCQKYEKTLPQLAIRWSIQLGVSVIMSSKSKDHLRENFEVHDFSITEKDMEYLNTLPQIGRSNDQGQDDVD